MVTASSPELFRRLTLYQASAAVMVQVSVEIPQPLLFNASSLARA